MHLTFLYDECVCDVGRVVHAEPDDEDDAHAGHGVDGQAPVEDVAGHVDLRVKGCFNFDKAWEFWYFVWYDL